MVVGRRQGDIAASALDHIWKLRGGKLDGWSLDRSEMHETGGQAAVAMARNAAGAEGAVKLFADPAAFRREAEVYRVLSKWGEAGRDFVLDVRDNSREPPLAPGVPMPSYIAMRRGESMHRWILKSAPAPARALWMLAEVCGQLAMMHDAGFVHRDIKPANILWLQDQSQWRLIDFGSAALSSEASDDPSFTLRFAAPETIRAVHEGNLTRTVGGKLSTIAHTSEDIWAIGVMAFELFSGRLFYLDHTASEIQAMLMGEVAFPHEQDEAVFQQMGRRAPIVRSMLNRDMHQRPDIHLVLEMMSDFHT